MRKCFTVCLLAFVMSGGIGVRAHTTDPAARPSTHVAGPHVRGASPRMSQLLQLAIQRSYTFASIVKQIDATDVIVHVEEVPTLPSGIDGRLTFVHAAGGVRYLRAQVAMGRGAIDLMSTVGHELQHALEVAQAKEVRDEASFEALYVRIGDKPAHPDRYDTPAAREAGRRVRDEMS